MRNLFGHSRAFPKFGLLATTLEAKVSLYDPIIRVSSLRQQVGDIKYGGGFQTLCYLRTFEFGRLGLL